MENFFGADTASTSGMSDRDMDDVFQLFSGDFDPLTSVPSIRHFVSIVFKGSESLFGDSLVSTVEDFTLFTFGMLNASKKADVVLAIAHIAKSLSAQNSLSKLLYSAGLYLVDTPGIIPQADDEGGWYFVKLLKSFTGINDTIGKRFIAVFSAVTTLAISRMIPKIDSDMMKHVFQKVCNREWSCISLAEVIMGVISECLRVVKGLFEGKSLKKLFTGISPKTLEDRVNWLNLYYPDFVAETLPTHGITEDKYLLELGETEEACTNSASSTQDRFAAAVYAKSKYTLMRLKRDVANHLASMDRRPTPFSFLIFGEAGVGKTTILNQLYTQLCKANDLDSDPKFRVVIDNNDKYMSTLKQYHRIYTIDDAMNARADKDDGSQADMIISCINSVPRTALKAEAQDKGKIMLRPWIVGVSTNIKDLQAHAYSVHPFSIIRRFPYTITMYLKPEYKSTEGVVDATKLAGIYDFSPWVFDVEIPTALKHNTYTYITAKHVFPDSSDPVELKNIDFSQLSYFLVSKSKAHFERENKLQAQLIQKPDFVPCEHHINPHLCKWCVAPPVDIVPHVLPRAVRRVAKGLYQRVVISYVGVLYCPSIRNFMICVNTASAGVFAVWSMLFPFTTLFVVVGGLYMCAVNVIGFISLFGYKFNRTYSQVIRTCDKYKQEIKKVTVIMTGLATMCIALRIFGYFSSSAHKHKGKRKRKKSSEEDIVEHAVTAPTRDQAPFEQGTVVFQKRNIGTNVWTSIKDHDAFVRQHKLSTSVTYERDIVKSCIPNSYHIIVHNVDDTKSSGWIFPIGGSHWIGAHHMFKKACGFTISGQSNVRRISSLVQISDLDLCLLSIFQLPLCPDTKKFLPESVNYFSGRDAVAWQPRDNILSPRLVKVDCVDVVTDNTSRVKSLRYDLTTRVGDCVFPIIAPEGVILGFHNAGIGLSSVTGLGQVVTKSMISEAVKNLSSHTGGICPHSRCISNEVEFDGVKPPHLRSPLRFVPNSNSIWHIGDHSKGTRTFRSQVIKSVISDDFAAVSGIEISHGKPMGMNSQFPWSTDIEALSLRVDIPPMLLRNAFDYVSNHIVDFVGTLSKGQVMEIGVLPEIINISGYDGHPFINAVNKSTSMGWPHNTPKTSFLDAYSDVYNGVTAPFVFSDKLRKEVIDVENKLASGESCCPIFRCNLKDEPTKLGSKKVRVMNGSPAAFLFVMRKYYLALVASFTGVIDVTSCCVGVNPFGEDWTKMARFIGKYKKCIAGDYSKYDKSMMAEEILRAFSVLVEVARCVNNRRLAMGLPIAFSDRDIAIMIGIATDVAFAILEHNGSFIETTSGMPSGHGLTVYVNSIVNVVRMCCVFMELEPDKDFFSNVNIITYGDDNVLSVSDDVPGFNHTSISVKLQEWGIKYTMADKDSESIPYLPIEEISFLKRKFNWDPSLGMYLAPLDVSSIYKMLHVHMVPAAGISKIDVARDAMKTALAESFHHGSGFYTEMRGWLMAVCDRKEWHLTKASFPSYEEAAQRFLASCGNTVVRFAFE